MLEVKTPEEALELIRKNFSLLPGRTEAVPLGEALGRVLAEDVAAREYVPAFDRSTVDGYALRAADTFGCSEAIPAILPVRGRVLMGEAARTGLEKGGCVYVPTGGAIPEGADCAVMIEYTEDYGDGSIGVMKPGVPGLNLIFRGDDARPGKVLLKAGRALTAQDIGALAAIGDTSVPVRKKLRVGVVSTGDELVPPEQTPEDGQMRNVNSALLAALLAGRGALALDYGIIADDEARLRETLRRALSDCDAVLVSGGSSVGEKDAAERVIGGMGELLLHGVAVKPGKPTMIGRVGGKPVVGLPGHPAAASFAARLFALPLLDRLTGRETPQYTVTAELTESVGANHGRAQLNACRLARKGGRLLAVPIRSKSGLITQLAGADGFFIIGRDCEGLPAGAQVQVYTD